MMSSYTQFLRSSVSPFINDRFLYHIQVTYFFAKAVSGDLRAQYADTEKQTHINSLPDTLCSRTRPTAATAYGPPSGYSQIAKARLGRAIGLVQAGVLVDPAKHFPVPNQRVLRLQHPLQTNRESACRPVLPQHLAMRFLGKFNSRGSHRETSPTGSAPSWPARR